MSKVSVVLFRTLPVSFEVWESYGKMSPKQDKTVPELVEKYRKAYPGAERGFLRKVIRLENGIVNPSELRKLDRYLRKSFESSSKDLKPSLEVQTGKRPISWLEQRAERKRFEQWQEDIAYERETDKIRVRTAVHEDIKKQAKQLDRPLTMDEKAAIEEKWTTHYAKLTNIRYGLKPEKTR